jgi:hypothetical protein
VPSQPIQVSIEQDAGLSLGFQPHPVKAAADQARPIPKWAAHHLPSLFGIRYVGHLNEKSKSPKNSLRIDCMATSMHADFSASQSQPVASIARLVGNRRRQITPQAGHALEILGHAIEYLTDEFVHHGGDVSSRNPQLEAVQLLMSLNRQVYFECPEVPTVRERIRSMFHFNEA